MYTSYRRSTVLFAMFFTAVTVARAKPPSPADFGGSYTGEVVVRSLSSTRVVVGLDEHGLGFADRLFFADTAQPIGPFAARSSVARVQYSTGQLVVVVPSAQRTFVFQVPSARQGGALLRQEQLHSEIDTADEGNGRIELDGGFLQQIGFEAIHVENVLQLAAYAGLRQRVSLVEVENGKLKGVGPRSISAAGQSPQNQVPPGPDDGSGCRTSCSASCGGGSNCSVTCTNGHCGSCDCVTGHGASCTCN